VAPPGPAPAPGAPVPGAPVPADGEAGAIVVVLGAVVVALVVVLVVLEVEDSDPLSLEPQAVSALMAMTAAIPAVTGRRRVIR
jgi:hypothetical protein